ncbi:hypothetical protein [Legionella nagasakiensis]|uniref:hypothetical protein n=1 Tax=Legionella nagasakiensis TaxID=535290 RepID=UPI001054D7B3|nr:hypothetical protein [Legionella nagasakiensis]
MPTNKFHYIWMGRLPTGKHEDSFKDGPNTLAQQLRKYIKDVKERTPDSPNPQDQEIIMWVPEALIEGIKEAGLLDPDITLKPIEDLYKNAKHLTKKEIENLETTVELLGEHNAYASQKDILSAAILEEYGGYFLDTTTSIDSVEHLINNQPKDVWFPRITEEAAKRYDGVTVILPDVWALYNPTPGGGTFKAMAASYVQRCQFYFPDKFEGVTFDMDKARDPYGDLKSGYFSEESYGQGSAIMASPDRDELIGQTAIFSFLDGLNQTKGPLTDARMRELSSYAEEAPEGKKVVELGLEKFHRGLWRKQAIADAAEERREERIREQREERVETQMQQTAPPPTNRYHMFTVQGSDFANFKAKYQSLKGDALKHQIISDFEKKLSEITDRKTLDHFVADFKKSTAYEILSKGQGLTTRLFSLDTTSKIKIDNIVKDKERELDGQNLSIT